MTAVTVQWTCPRCHRPTSVTAEQRDAACCLDAVQKRHEKAHAAMRKAKR